MKLLTVILPALLLVGCSTDAPLRKAPNYAHSLGIQFQNASPAILLNDYAEKAGKRLEVVKGVDTYTARISLKSDGALTMQQYLDAIEATLQGHNIGIYPLGSNRLVAAWIDPSQMPQQATRTMSDPATRGTQSYIERMRARRDAAKPLPPPPPKYSGEELQGHLQKYNMELIRAAARGETNTPPLPIPLTPEQDAQLVREGILPPPGNE